jgi:predicted O-linked N-acetylglucosamine transferase (SPINDLY family)
LWLLRFPPLAEENLRREADLHQVPQNRIIFTNVAGKEDHIYRGNVVDMFLDTPECNGHTTAADILWAGTPILTYPKLKMASRVAASMANITGYGDQMIASSYIEYEEKAVHFGNNPHLLRDLKDKLKADRETSILFDTQRWVRNFESCFSSMWELHLQQKPPQHMRVHEGFFPDGKPRFELLE